MDCTTEIKEYAAKIKKLRSDLGVSLRELGAQLGTTDSTIQKLESGGIKKVSTYKKYLKLIEEKFGELKKQQDTNLLLNGPRFVARLKRICDRLGVSLSDLAKQSNISRQTFGNYRAGKNVSIRTATSIALILGIPLEALLDTTISPTELVARYASKTSKPSQEGGIVQKVKSFLDETETAIPDSETNDPEVFAAHFSDGIDYSLLSDDGKALMKQFFGIVLQLCPNK